MRAACAGETACATVTAQQVASKVEQAFRLPDFYQGLFVAMCMTV
ncbi:MAG TPA: hypothetical protein VKU01_25910 [Bryobacteraceae bacterium]|nr:hypothetical protein [Bryobacteraceae bacterium]